MSRTNSLRDNNNVVCSECSILTENQVRSTPSNVDFQHSGILVSIPVPTHKNTQRRPSHIYMNQFIQDTSPILVHLGPDHFSACMVFSVSSIFCWIYLLDLLDRHSHTSLSSLGLLRSVPVLQKASRMPQC